MDRIRQQVAAARRRMVVQQFLGIAAWSLFATLVIAAVGLAVPKIWFLAVDGSVWTWSWLAGSAGAGLLIAIIWTTCVRTRPLEAAIELDRRFQLKERVSSALSLSTDEMDSEVGQALLQDAARRVERIDVRDSFRVRPHWRVLLPFVPAALAFVLATDLIPDAAPPQAAQAATQQLAQAKQVQRSAKKLQERLALQQQKAQNKGLEDTDLLFKHLQQGLDDLANKSEVDRKNALVKMNDLAKSLQERKNQLGGADKLRDQFNRLKEIEPGPADKLAQAMKEGDFQQALDELKKLQEKLQTDKLTDAEKEQLAKQLEQLQKKLQEAADAHAQAKRDLEKEIERRKQAGDLEGAGQLQRQLDQMNRMNDQMSRLQKLAENLGQCKQCMQSGDGKAAAGELDQLVQGLKELQEQMDELETLDQMMDEIAQAKEAMGCDKCGGEGCGACQGQGAGQMGDQQGNGMGLGEGRGRGERPEERTDTGVYESRVAGKVQPGEAVTTGTSSGPNRAGKSLEDVKNQIQSNLHQESDPLVDVRLPRKEREHTKEYFERLREGK